jgi:Spy/CpxP family protein refolding chaperone
MKPRYSKKSLPFLRVLLAVLVSMVLVNYSNFSLAAEEEKAPPAKPKVRASKVDRTESRIQKLYGELKITPAQEELWKAFTQVMRDNAKTLDELNLARAEKSKTMNAVEDLKSYSEIVQAHAEGLNKYVTAFEALYNSMSDEQKKNADLLFRGGRHQKGKRK